MPTVFLSYRQENNTHRERVRELGLRLRKEGLTVILDQLANEDEFHRGSPPEGWGRWSMTQAAEAKIDWSPRVEFITIRKSPSYAFR